MIINHNLGAMNAMRNMGTNAANANKSMEKLSSGLKINRAGDDAAGLAISEKMRGQIRGLDQASANAQDGISMLQTAEGALSETQSILQRMRELAVQSGNDTNVGVDRTEIQKEMNQLSSEINRIGNTTEFNTKSLLKGDGKTNLNTTNIANVTGKLASGTDRSTTEATQTVTLSAAAATSDTAKFVLNGISLTATFKTSGSNGTVAGDNKAYNVTSTSADIALDATATSSNGAAGLRDAFQKMIDANETLKGNYVVSGTGSNVTISAVKGGSFEGAAGNMGAFVKTGSGLGTAAATANSGVTTAATVASKTVNFASLTGADAVSTDTNLKDLVGKGMTINGQQIEFYNSNDGAYTGDAIGVNISTALSTTGTTTKVEELVKNIAQQLGSKIDGVKLSQDGTTATQLNITATTAGTAGNNLEVSDGGTQKSFEATLQVGANKGQGFKIDINDMRSLALKVTGAAGSDATEGAKYTSTNTVTNGTDSTTREAALDVSTYENATAAVKVLNNAIESVSSERSKLGAFQNRLEHTIANLGTSSENLTSAESRVRDVDMAKEMSQFSKNNILSQAAQAMLAQANQQPQQVLQLLR